MYKAQLTILNKVWTTKGKTVDELLSSFDLEWNQIKGKGVLIVEGKGKKHEHLMTMRLIRRIFSNKVVREHWARNLEYLLINDSKSNGTIGSNVEVAKRRGRPRKQETIGSSATNTETA